jgi:hypothetical protein
VNCINNLPYKGKGWSYVIQSTFYIYIYIFYSLGVVTPSSKPRTPLCRTSLAGHELKSANHVYGRWHLLYISISPTEDTSVQTVPRYFLRSHLIHQRLYQVDGLSRHFARHGGRAPPLAYGAAAALLASTGCRRPQGTPGPVD